MTLPLLSALSGVTASSNHGAEVVTSDGRSLPLLGATLRGEARGGLARLVLEQRFANRHAEPLHVTYRMPLPANGAVSAYAFELAGRVITGVVEPRAKARETFERAVAEGKTAAILDQERADIFTQQLGNLPPGEELIARTTIDVRLTWLPEGEWELRFPTVIGPRYVDNLEDATATHVEVAVGGVAARVGIEIAIGDALVAGRGASSASHGIVQTTKDDAVVVGLRDQSALDRDLVLRWPVASASVGLSLATHRRPTGDAFGLLTIVPPAPAARATSVARDLIILLDTSGSMGGLPLDMAKQVIHLLMASLGDADRFEIIEFSNRPRPYQPEPVAATAEARSAALKWVNKLSAGGGTEMASAVSAAMSMLRPDAQRQVVLISDGYVGGEAQILRTLLKGLPGRCRLHVVGVGAAPNRSLAQALARAGRGAEVLVGMTEDLERVAKRLLDRTTAPALTDVVIEGSALVRHVPRHVPDVFAGSPIVAGLELSPAGGELVVRGRRAHDTWEQRISVPARAPGTGNAAIAALYAREHVADLEMEWSAGGNAAAIESDRAIESTGVEFQISTRMTSWVAVDQSRRVATDGRARHEVVPQELPFGTSAASFGLRSSMPGMLDTLEEEPTFASFGSVTKTRAGLAPGPMKTMMVRSSASEPMPVKEYVRQESQVAPPGQAPRASAKRVNIERWVLAVLVLAALLLALWWLV